MRYGFKSAQEWPNPPFGGNQNAQQTVNNIVNYIREQEPNADFAKIMADLKSKWNLTLHFYRDKNFYHVDLSINYRMLLRPVKLEDGTFFVCIEIYQRSHENEPTVEEHTNFLNKYSPEKAKEHFPEHIRGNPKKKHPSGDSLPGKKKHLSGDSLPGKKKHLSGDSLPGKKKHLSGDSLRPFSAK